MINPNESSTDAAVIKTAAVFEHRCLYKRNTEKPAVSSVATIIALLTQTRVSIVSVIVDELPRRSSMPI